MARRVNLDAMIPREDFEVKEEETAIDLFKDFPITHLAPDAPYLKLLRKPDFQRETNHWSPDQIAIGAMAGLNRPTAATHNFNPQ
jgi:hypothetical protein